MNLEEDFDNQIMNYLDGTMTPNERKAFEIERLNSAELDESLTILENMDKAYDDKDWLLLTNKSEKIKEISNLYKGDHIKNFSNKVRMSQRRYQSKIGTKKLHPLIKYIISIAAVGLLILLIDNYFNSNYSTIDLYETYYTTDDLPSFVLKSDDVNTMMEAELFFKEGKFSDALKLFKGVYENSESLNPNILIYISLSSSELNKYDDALKYLDTLEQSKTIDFHKAYWFKSLVYLKQGLKEKSSLNLKKISKNKDYFNYNKAINLLKALD